MKGQLVMNFQSKCDHDVGTHLRLEECFQYTNTKRSSEKKAVCHISTLKIIFISLGVAMSFAVIMPLYFMHGIPALLAAGGLAEQSILQTKEKIPRTSQHRVSRVAYLDARGYFEGKRGRLVEPLNSTYVKPNDKNETTSDDCVPMFPWHTDYHPICNNFHELQFEKDLVEILGEGTRRIAYKVNTAMGHEVALTSLQYNWEGKEVSWAAILDKYTERVRTDVTVLDHLTPVKCVINTYGYCGLSTMNELADRINFHEKTENLTQTQTLAYSQYITSCLADIHGIDGKSNTSITHADLHLENIWFVDGIPKIADFGNAKLLEWNITANRTCDFVVNGDRIGMFFYRSPEVETSAKINDESRDLYQLGYILYTILHNGDEPYNIEPEEAMKIKLKGHLPKFNKEYEKNDDPGISAVVGAIKTLFSVKPEDRPRAWQVAKDLRENMPWKDIDQVINAMIHD